MAKFLDKKEQVIDFQLTPYGKHRLSVGQLKPAYYAFFDTGVTYDSEYAGFSEVQTKIHERIKTETQFLEGVLLFEEIENSAPLSQYRGQVGDVRTIEIISGTYVGITGTVNETGGAFTGESVYGYVANKYEYIIRFLSARIRGGGLTGREAIKPYSTEDLGAQLADLGIVKITGGDSTSLFDLDIVPQQIVPKPDILSFESSIGDAKFEGENTQTAPAWKLLSCQGEITKVQERDTSKYDFSIAEFDNEVKEFNIPQIDIKASYTLEISSPSSILTEEMPSDFLNETSPFADGNTIKLIKEDVVVYAEEMNTELLTENFEVEVFEMLEEAGLTVQAEGTILAADQSTQLEEGDTLTISDGITTTIFEIIADTAAGKTKAINFGSGRVGVVKSSNYKISGAGSNRKGTILNLISAINQDTGEMTLGYPTPANQGTTAGFPFSFLPNNGRCSSRFHDLGPCYVGRHNLKVNIPRSSITGVRSHAFSSGPYEINITNNNTNIGNPNAAMTAAASSGDITTRLVPSGFTGGYTAKGTQLKRKYFSQTAEQVVDGFMMAATEGEIKKSDLTEDSVEYYFQVLTDKLVDGKIACSCANTFNRDSYYIDVDFDCLEDDKNMVFSDIYGSATSPEICEPILSGDGAGLSDLAPEEDFCEDE